MPELPEPAPAVATQAQPVNHQDAWRRPASVIAVVALSLLAWQWLETRVRLSDAQTELARRLAQSDAVVEESRGLARNAQEVQAAEQARVALLETRLAEVQDQQATFATLYKELNRANDERLLAEVEQGLVMADQQLRLAGNVQIALIALSSVDTQLAHAARPQFAPLHQMITRDIERLQALPGTDVSGLTQKLETIVAAIDTLPLAFEQHPKPEPVKAPVVAVGFWQSLVSDFRQSMGQLVHIERIDTARHIDPGVLSPSQSLFLRENLKLRLGYARLALLTKDGPAFHEDIRQAHTWLERYFDGRNKSVQTALLTLRNLQEASVGAELPTLGTTLDAVRNFKIVRSGK